MTQILSRDDIREFLIGFAAAIELDQLRADALLPEQCHPYYSDGMWRRWRRSHLDYIHQVLPTVDAIPQRLLERLTRIAIHYEPAVVKEVALDIFADAASNSCPMEELETATLFFDWLIKGVFSGLEGKQIHDEARSMMMQWLPVTDPLRISQDPECGYGVPLGFVN